MCANLQPVDLSFQVRWEDDGTDEDDGDSSDNSWEEEDEPPLPNIRHVTHPATAPTTVATA